MTDRLVIRVQLLISGEGHGSMLVSLENPPGNQATPFACNGSEPEFVALASHSLGETSVRDAGRLLFDGLAAQPDIGLHLPAAAQPGAAKRPVFVELRAPGAAEALPWETLWSQAVDFLGLDARWPVSRIVPPVGDNPVHLEEFRPPLRIAAILSCLGVTAADEWQILSKEVAAVAGRLDVEVLTFVSEHDLALSIQKAADPGVSVDLVPQDLATLREKVSSFRPHILHLFCHGRLRQRPQLEIAVAADWQDGVPNRSLRLEFDQISQLSNPMDPAWLAVLNCCEVGAPVGETYSLARELVNRGPFAAAVAMSEPVNPDDASAFSAALYPQLLAAVENVVQAKGNPVEIPFWNLLVEPRRRLCERQAVGGISVSMAATSTKEWTVPVLYVRPDPLVLSWLPGPAPTLEEVGRQQLHRRALAGRGP
ncbi:CHAT domain-containing protein [Streptomyces sp. R21]|uniref:CHAT domain-containing protein n=1 Tax=Streptomyces sp. R21 TaxID=3238627 RepID=A0AB39NYX7_9ACTN